MTDRKRFALRITSSETNGPSGAGDDAPGRRDNPRTREGIAIQTSREHLDGLRRMRSGRDLRALVGDETPETGERA